MAYADLLAEYRKLAKRANQRLVRLERYKAEGMKEATSYAYSYAQSSIQGFRGEQFTRWSESGKGYTYSDLNMMLSDIQSFLNKPTSTKTGFMSINDRRTQKLNETLGTEFSSTEFQKFMETGGLFDKLIAQFGYREAFKAGSVIMQDITDRQKNLSKRQIMESLKQVTLSDVDVVDKDMKAKIRKLMRARGKLGE